MVVLAAAFVLLIRPLSEADFALVAGFVLAFAAVAITMHAKQAVD
jgi:inner membrane protein involved in colicin E2 resistance